MGEGGRGSRRWKVVEGGRGAKSGGRPQKMVEGGRRRQVWQGWEEEDGVEGG